MGYSVTGIDGAFTVGIKAEYILEENKNAANALRGIKAEEVNVFINDDYSASQGRLDLNNGFYFNAAQGKKNNDKETFKSNFANGFSQQRTEMTLGAYAAYADYLRTGDKHYLNIFSMKSSQMERFNRILGREEYLSGKGMENVWRPLIWLNYYTLGHAYNLGTWLEEKNFAKIISPQLLGLLKECSRESPPPKRKHSRDIRRE